MMPGDATQILTIQSTLPEREISEVSVHLSGALIKKYHFLPLEMADDWSCLA